jgi:hypothetical protein
MTDPADIVQPRLRYAGRVTRTGNNPDPAVAAALALGRRLDGERMRAPRQGGHRAQMTIPEAVWNRAVELAELVGTTANDVLAVYATKGMKLTDRQIETAGIAAARVEALAEGAATTLTDELPSIEELLGAATALRDESAG